MKPLRDRIREHLDGWGADPDGRAPLDVATRTLRMIVDVQHIAVDASQGLCIDCGWLDPCPTVVTVGLELGVAVDADWRAE